MKWFRWAEMLGSGELRDPRSQLAPEQHHSPETGAHEPGRERFRRRDGWLFDRWHFRESELRVVDKNVSMIAKHRELTGYGHRCGGIEGEFK